MSEYRYDVLLDEYVLIAPERLRRPDYFNNFQEKKSEFKKCPFCKGNEDLTPKEIYSFIADNYKIRVIPNLYKAVSIEENFKISNNSSIYQSANGFGAHEIIIDTDKHLTNFSDLSQSEIFNWLNVVKCRIEDLRKDSRITYISVFKNEGESSGATVPHIHTQLIAMPVIPRNKLINLWHLNKFYKQNNIDAFEKILQFELSEKNRVVFENDFFAVICPYASRFSFETIILPKINLPYLDLLSSDILESLSEILNRLFLAYKRALGDFDFNLSFANPPLQKTEEIADIFENIDNFFRFHIRVIPRLYKIGGFEINNKIHINPVSPEKSAEELKKLKNL
jgi:UDPglucose--hexose-1-phosphate uridylyltransferase